MTLSKYLRNSKVCVDFLCLDFGVQADGSRNPKIFFSAVDGVLLLKIAGLFCGNLLQLIIYVRAVYSIVSHLENYFNFAHRLSRLEFRF